MASGTTFPIRSDLATSLPNPEKVIALSGLTKPANLPQGIDESYRRFFSAVPLANATIRKISLPSDHRPHGLVFHIQDVHRNREAQTNISNVVTALIKERTGSSSIALVGLEGEFRPYRLGWLRSFPEPNAFRLAAEEMLVQDRLSGPMLSLLTAPHPIPAVVGIDDLFHYTANLDAYRRSLPSKEGVQARLAIEKKSLEDEKLSAFNPALLAYDKSVQDYQKGLSPLGSYVHALGRKAGSPLGEPLTLFLRALHMEETLDFKQIETERTQLLEILSHQLSRPQINDLIAQSLSYRAGQISSGDFYRRITALCQKAGVSLGRFPAMEGYIQYVLLAEGIDAEALFQDCRKREIEIYTLLAKTGPEQALVERSRRLSLILKLTHFSLTPEEWADYERMSPPQTPVPDLEPYESFYHEAFIRDTSMAKNFLSALNRTKGGGSSDISPLVSILVTGGYHAPGLTEKLTQAGMAVVSIVPKIEKVDTGQGSAYLSVFAQEKTPLDKLFEGAKLFVADKPLSERSAATLAMGAAAVAVHEKGALSNNILAFLNQQFKNVQLAIEKNVIKFRFGFGKQNESGTFDDSKIAGQRIIMDPPSNDWADRWQAAMESSRPTRLAQEIPLFLSATMAPALLFGVSLYFGLGPWTAMAQAIVGIGFAQGNWPAFREAHGISQTNWLAKNPETTVSDYQKNLLKRYWSIVLVSQISAIAMALCFLGNPVTTGSETIWKTVTVGAFSLFFGPFLFHGTQNFIGTFRHGSHYVAAMIETNPSSQSQQPLRRQPGDPWIELFQIPEGFLRGRTVIVRTNLDDTQIDYDDMRLNLALKTVRLLKDAGAKVILLSHIGRPEQGFDSRLTNDSRADQLAYMIDTEFKIKMLQGERTPAGFRWVSDSDKDSIKSMKEGEVVMLQNTRFDPRETSPDNTLRMEMAHELADIAPEALFVLDGFPVAHRGDTVSVDGLAHILPGVKGLWQTLEERLHNEFLERLDNPEARGKLTVLFGGGKLDKQTEISAFCREHMRAGDNLVIAGKFRSELMPGDLKKELEDRGVTLIIAGPEDGNDQDIGAHFAQRALEAITESQTVFWEGPLGRYRDPKASSNIIARHIKNWAENNLNRKAFISGGSTSYLFKTANNWKESDRSKAVGVTVSTGGGTSIAYFAHRGTLPATKALRGVPSSPSHRATSKDKGGFTKLSKIPDDQLRGRLVILRTNQDDPGVKTIQSLIKTGAKVVVMSHESIGEHFINKLGVGSPHFLKGETQSKGWRWLSVADKTAIENMDEGQVLLLQNAGQDWRANDPDLSKGKEMAMELAGIDPDQIFVLDVPPTSDSAPGPVKSIASFIPGVRGLSIETDSDLSTLWGWDPTRSLSRGTVGNEGWASLLHDPNNRKYVFIIDEKKGSYQAILRQRTINPSQDLFGQIMGFILLQNKVNAAFGNKLTPDGKPIPDNFVKIQEDGTTVNYIVFTKNGNHSVYQSDVPDEVMDNPETVLIINQNTKRASRPGGTVTKVSEISANNNLEMYKFTPNYVKAQLPIELYSEWRSKAKQLWIFTCNPFPYFPNHLNRTPKHDVDHIMISRGDKHVPQAEISSLESITDVFEAMDELNSSPKMKGKIPFHLGINGWYYGKDFKAGASQNHAHAHLLRERFPVQHAPIKITGTTNGVQIGILADPENGPGLVLEASRGNLNALIKTTHEVVSRITAKSHSFNILAIPINGGYRVIIADKIGGVPTHRFQNEFAFAESCGRIIMGDDPRKVFKFTDQQMSSFNEIDPTNKPAIIKWVQSEYADGNLTVDSDLYNETRADIRSVSAPPDEIMALAKEVFLSQNTSRGPPHSSNETLVQRIGGKAVGLMELDEIPEILVPKWNVLPVSIFEEFLQENPTLQEMIKNLSSARNESDQDVLLEKIRSSIGNSPLPTSSSIGKRIRDAYQNIAQQTGTPNPTVSVRSSSPAEDKTSASYAGQYKTILDVQGEAALIHAVKQVWASTFSSGAVRYRLEQNPGQVWAPMSVIIQQMIDGQAAGTAFTIDLETGSPGFYTINATLGAGEAEVAGMVTSDRYLVDSSTLETITRRLGQKDVKISPPRKGENGSQLRPTSESERKNYALNDETVNELARGIQRIQKHFREKLGITSLDVEYVIDQAGTIYFLQCRPETVWSKKPPKRLTVAGPAVKHLPSFPLGGLTANPGVAQGTLRVISNVGEKGVLQAESVVHEGDILVVTHTTNIWERVLAKAGGAITDTGGPGCHTAVVARESGKPAVVGTGTGVSDLSPYDGQQVILDATDRVIYVGTLSEQAISEAPISPPQYSGMDTQTEDETWVEVLKSGTAIDRGEGIRWIGKPNYALTPFMKEIYLEGHKYIAKLLEVPTRLDFFQDIHVILYSDLFKWREKLRTLSVKDLERIQRLRVHASNDYLKRSSSLKPRALDFRKWVNSFTKINSFIAVGYSFSRVTEGLLEKELEEKGLQEPYYSQVRTATAGSIGETESAHFLHLYNDLLEVLRRDTALSEDLSEALLKSAWVPFSKNHEAFSGLLFRVAYDFKISSRTEPTVALTDPIEALARLLLQDIHQNRQIRIPKQSTEDFFPSDAKFVKIARLSVGAEKAREDAHHLKMRGLWLFRKNMEPFVQWLIINGNIQRYEDLFNHPVKWIEKKLSAYEHEQGQSLDSLLSRKLRNAEKNSTSQVKALGWKWVRWTHDFMAAPVYETAFFFLFPAASGSLVLLGVGVFAFMGLHFWDDYAGAKSSGLSPPSAFKTALQAAGPRLLRTMVLYTAPFAMFMMSPDFLQIFANAAPSPFSPPIENHLMKIAGIVALLHMGRNLYLALEKNTIFLRINEKWTVIGLKSQAVKEGQLMGKVILGMPNDLGQAMEIINKHFPETKPLGLKNLGSPGMGHLIKLGVNLQQSDFDNAFTSSLQKFISVNSQRKEHFPSTVQALARMRYFADSQGWAKDEENQTPVELQICTTDDLPTIQETLVLLQEANEKQEKKVYLLLAGANRQTVGALKEAAQGMKYVGVAETPVAQNTNGDENPILVPHLLNSEFNSLRERLKLPPEIVLAVSLSEQITFTNEQLRDVDENQLDKALRAALRRFLFSFPIQPVHFTTMLRILKKAREGIDQSA